jgi:hypothetical protein
VAKSPVVADRILAKLNSPDFSSARFVLAEDFLDAGPNSAVYMALSRLSASGRLHRVSTGIYATSAASETSLDWTDELAGILARKARCLIQADGRAMSVSLGIAAYSHRHLYMSDGGQAKLSWQGHEIEIKRVRPVLFDAASTEAGRIVQAIYWMGPAHRYQCDGVRPPIGFTPAPATLAALTVLVPKLPPWAGTAVKALLDLWT